MESSIIFKSRQKEIIEAFSNFNIIELPAGYLGEIKEAIDTLNKNAITVNENNVLKYIKAKGAIMSFFRKRESELIKTYLIPEQEKTTAGILIPEWVIVAALLLGFFVDVKELLNTIKSILKKSFPYEDDNKITQTAEQIINIKEAKDLTIIINKNIKDN